MRISASFICFVSVEAAVDMNTSKLEAADAQDVTSGEDVRKPTSKCFSFFFFYTTQYQHEVPL